MQNKIKSCTLWVNQIKARSLTLRDQGMTLSDVLGESEGVNPYSASAATIFVMRIRFNALKPLQFII